MVKVAQVLFLQEGTVVKTVVMIRKIPLQQFNREIVPLTYLQYLLTFCQVIQNPLYQFQQCLFRTYQVVRHCRTVPYNLDQRAGTRHMFNVIDRLQGDSTLAAKSFYDSLGSTRKRIRKGTHKNV